MLVNRSGASARRGGALVAALISVTTVAAMGAAVMQLQMAALRRHSRAVDTKRALYVAEAGLAEAFFAVAQGKSGNVGSSQIPARFGNGVFWVEAEWLSQDQIQLYSTGLCGSGRFSIGQMIRRPTNLVGVLGLYGGEGIVVGEGAVLDGYDSREGDWEEPPASDPMVDATGDPSAEPNDLDLVSAGDVRILGGVLQYQYETVTTQVKQGGNGNGKIWVSEQVLVGVSSVGPTTRVLGDVQASGVIDIDPGVEVAGTTAYGVSVPIPPTIDPPDVPLMKGLMEVSERLILSGEAYGYEHIKVLPESALHLEGPLILVTGRLEVLSSGGLVIDASQGPVAIYVTGQLHLNDGSILDTTGSAADVGLFYLGGDAPQDFRFQPSGEYHGLLFAPSGNLVVPPDLRLFGSITAEVLEFAPGSQVTHDVATQTSSIGEQELPLHLGWWIAPLPDEELVRTSQNPLAALRLRGVEPTASYDAHLEEEIALLYIDTGSNFATYTGWASDLDWSQVQEVLQYYWTDSPAPVGPGNVASPQQELIADKGLTSSEVKDALLLASPLWNVDMISAMKRDPPMNTSDLKDVLEFNSPLGSAVLVQLTKGYAPLESGDLKSVLVAQPGLSALVIDRVKKLPSTVLDPSDLAAVLLAQ